MYMTLGMYRADSLTTVAEDISKYELNLVGSTRSGGTERWHEPAAEYTFFFYGKGNENHELGTGLFPPSLSLSLSLGK
jgi:hypothetical protein